MCLNHPEAMVGLCHVTKISLTCVQVDRPHIYIYIYICTGVALHNLIGRFKHAQRANVRPAQTSSGQAF